MAILSSFTGGKARKSVGSITYTRLNGQHIAKGKVARNPNKISTESQIRSQIYLVSLNTAYKAFKSITDKIYLPTKRGSVYNSFIKVWMNVLMTTRLSEVYIWKPDTLNEAHNMPISGFLAAFYGYPSSVCPFSAGGGMKLNMSIYPKKTNVVINITYEDGSLLTNDFDIKVYCICSNDPDFLETKVFSPNIAWTYDANGGSGSFQSAGRVAIPYDYMIIAPAVSANGKPLSSSKMYFIELFD